MNSTFERKINYYETDKMGVVHHSNYIRYLEEARCHFLDIHGFPYSYFEKNGVSIPVLSVNCSYKQPVTYDDILLIEVFVKEYSGVRLVIGYSVIDKKTNNTVIIAETKHCFTDINFKPLNLKKYFNELSKKFEALEQPK